jgi:hypothetical protein
MTAVREFAGFPLVVLGYVFAEFAGWLIRAGAFIMGREVVEADE